MGSAAILFLKLILITVEVLIRFLCNLICFHQLIKRNYLMSYLNSGFVHDGQYSTFNRNKSQEVKLEQKSQNLRKKTSRSLNFVTHISNKFLTYLQQTLIVLAVSCTCKAFTNIAIPFIHWFFVSLEDAAIQIHEKFHLRIIFLRIVR